MAINKVILIGNVGKDPDIRTMTNGSEIALFSLATTESWKDKQTGVKKEKTEWHRVVVFSSGLASIVKQYVKKGSKLYIEGSLRTRKWTDNKGVERYTTEVMLQGFNSVLQMLDSNKGGSVFNENYYKSLESNSDTPVQPESINDEANTKIEELIVENFEDKIPF